MANLTLSSNTTDFTTTLNPPIYLNTSKRYEAAFLSMHTYNSIPNITETNNKFKYSTDKGVSWKTITFERGAYELTEINLSIQREMQLYSISTEYPEIEIDFYKPTSKSILVISNENFMGDFGVENSIASILGLTNEKLGVGTHQSPNIIDIEKVNSILVHCDIIMGTYVNGSRSHVIHNFTQRVSPGYKIIERPSPELTFLPVLGRPDIQSIRIWLTDQDNNPIDHRGEKITMDILIREKL